MTTVALPRSAVVPPVPLVLGLQEGVRIVRHPISVTGLSLLVVLSVVESGDHARDAFETIASAPTFFYGVFVYFAAHLVASRDRRSHSRELLAATPVPPTGRVAGLCLAALVPAAVALGFVLVVHAISLTRGIYVEPPSVWHLAQSPLTVLGGALLGIMVARLTRVPGMALLVMIVMFVANAWVNEHPATIRPLGTFMAWVVWAPDGAWAGLHSGSAAWHVGYLAALCAMAATGAFLAEARRTWRVLLAGAGFTALAVVAGWAQLP